MTEQSVNPQAGLERLDRDVAMESLLFVDDEANILSSLRRLFRSLGYNIYVAESGKQGLEILRQHPVDLVISDMRMPEMDGAAFLEQVATGYPDTVRILLTGFSDIASTVEAINKGSIYRYLSKPWNDAEITLTVRQALKTKSLEREKLQLTAQVQRQYAELQDLNNTLEQRVTSRTEELQQVADMLDLAYQQLSDSYQGTIQVFSGLISMREALSGRYAQKVAELARTMAKAFGLAEEETRHIYFAGLLHELGKLGLSDKLLEQPVYSLSPEDLKKYRRHPINGQAALMAVEELQLTATLIGTHEEYGDGSGFPLGLKGGGIPIGARILSIAKDYFGYKTGRLLPGPVSTKEALEKIQRYSHKLYDPELVDVLSVLVASRLAAADKLHEVKLGTRELAAGMTLARNLYNVSDMLLLTKGRVLSEMLIRKLIQLEKHEGHGYEVYVLEEASVGSEG
ncbi:MAG: response regulator RpfG family c-di-GMP phosphodiesterase [Motiliproteus sp.]|jgi:response regulator RpfG family c-di-GMP phosphodiesterase